MVKSKATPVTSSSSASATLTPEEKFLNHVTENLCRDDSGRVKSAFKLMGLNDPFDLAYTIEADDVDMIDFKYEVPLAGNKSRQEDLPHTDVQKIKQFYILVKEEMLKAALKDETFDPYSLMSIDKKAVFAAVTRNAVALAPQSSGNADTTRSLEQLNRSIKFDPKGFKQIKDDRYFPSASTEIVNTAKLMNVAEPFDSGYVPTTQDQIELFKRQQELVMEALKNILISPQGKIIYTKYKKTGDAQQCWSEYADYASKAYTTTTDLDEIYDHIMGLKWDRTFRGTMTDFLTHVETKIAEYNSRIEDPKLLLDGEKMLIKLQAMVREHPEMYRAEQDNRSAKRNQGIDRDFPTYLAYIKEVAGSIDARALAMHPKSFQRRIKCQISDYSDILEFNELFQQPSTDVNVHNVVDEHQATTVDMQDMVPVYDDIGNIMCYRLSGNRRTIEPSLWRQLEPWARKAIQLGRPLLDNEGPQDASQTPTPKETTRQANNHDVAVPPATQEGEDFAATIGTDNEQAGNLYALLHDAYVNRNRKSA